MDGVTCRVVLRDFPRQIKDSHTRSNNAKRRTKTDSHHCRRGGACLSTWWSEPPSHWTPQTWSKQGTWILRRQRWELEHDLHLTTSQWGGGGGDTGSGEIYRDLILSVLWDGWINPTLLQSFCSTGGLSRFSVVGFTRLCTDKPKPDSGEELSLFCSVWAQMNLQNLHVGKWHELEELAASSLRSGRIKPCSHNGQTWRWECAGLELLPLLKEPWILFCDDLWWRRPLFHLRGTTNLNSFSALEDLQSETIEPLPEERFEPRFDLFTKAAVWLEPLQHSSSPASFHLFFLFQLGQEKRKCKLSRCCLPVRFERLCMMKCTFSNVTEFISLLTNILGHFEIYAFY